ncbi:Trifunctional UDP-glucose 4,6-dehydratase/UDP-4-keto-6-deoxy-D-glucose 3,5-epimerase/UDP-4-keto-L-rhamnose-reductase RHM1 [Thalictrum thalictroides]|uniref:Trifunctional UDP-glucose 4,6-dehydratase/UDP-4-keto-6-deoxy-D-glucose 3,5-epimerase/UDP-4-keto-L-rhamnose-reductase RHM1 n=1 Tax=Thalictrum thalictroides TaxID=46969 RepID=A0A7J6X938_THATH|nr:Trifunctional UDP-glucose 4,6-dehydratase/UDP-4-keto-6-deoxy-D-glucose 3,5-epimerase/UDP-4-keto-L-rhamnose-reductase RHM1 [Thalictrum thalictroides]
MPRRQEYIEWAWRAGLRGGPFLRASLFFEFFSISVFCLKNTIPSLFSLSRSISRFEVSSPFSIWIRSRELGYGLTPSHTPKNILITSAAGFIASHVANQLIKNYPDYKIVILDKLDM